jgi:hypothetical protein
MRRYRIFPGTILPGTASREEDCARAATPGESCGFTPVCQNIYKVA